jgi:hypothetical protein
MEKINYIKQLNNFFEVKIINPISSNAQCLYINLFYINNKCSWKERFTVSNTMLIALTGIDRRTLDRVRNELVQKRYIEYTKGKGNQSGEYLLVQFDTQSDIQYDIQYDIQNGIQTSHNMTTLNKLNKTKQNLKKESKKEKPLTFDELIDNYTQNETLKYELKEHLKTRKAKKATLTNRAIELACSSLDKLSQDDETKIAIVRQSIASGWTGFFPLKQENRVEVSTESERERRTKMLQEKIERGEL